MTLDNIQRLIDEAKVKHLTPVGLAMKESTWMHLWAQVPYKITAREGDMKGVWLLGLPVYFKYSGDPEVLIDSHEMRGWS